MTSSLRLWRASSSGVVPRLQGHTQRQSALARVGALFPTAFCYCSSWGHCRPVPQKALCLTCP